MQFDYWALGLNDMKNLFSNLWIARKIGCHDKWVTKKMRPCKTMGYLEIEVSQEWLKWDLIVC